MQQNVPLYWSRQGILLEKYCPVRSEMIADEVPNDALEISEGNLSNVQDRSVLLSRAHHFVRPFTFYQSFTYDVLDRVPLESIFLWSPEVRDRAKDILDWPFGTFTSVHVRLGDKFLETDKRYVLCTEDQRNLDEASLRHFVLAQEKPFLFFCDNNSYRHMVASWSPHVTLLQCSVGHTSLSNTTETQYLDALVEMYIMSQSETIVSFTNSGFSIVASKFVPCSYVRM
jgi:hypothetical protein